MEAGYAHVEFDDFQADGDALALQGSFALNDMFNLVGSYQDGSIDSDFNVDVDVKTLELGGGSTSAQSDGRLGHPIDLDHDGDRRGFVRERR
jgi:hypothetical protein